MCQTAAHLQRNDGHPLETCYKVFRREVLAGIRLQSDRFGFEPEITAKIAKGRRRGSFSQVFCRSWLCIGWELTTICAT